INLISAQGLKEPTGKLRRFQTYASVWDDSSRLLWSSSSAKLLAFISRSVPLVTCEHLIGTVCFLLSNFLPTTTFKVSSLVLPADFFKSVQEKAAENRRERKMIKSRSVVSFDDQGGSSKDNSLSGSVNFSYVGTDLMWSSPLPSPLRDWNAIRNQAGKNQVRSSSDGGGLMCCCLMKSSGMIPGS
ncbi:hypothetical protein BRARA_B02548, partial [Brassica rapa]